jgi:hypothetical protein
MFDELDTVKLSVRKYVFSNTALMAESTLDDDIAQDIAAVLNKYKVKNKIEPYPYGAGGPGIESILDILWNTFTTVKDAAGIIKLPVALIKSLSLGMKFLDNWNGRKVRRPVYVYTLRVNCKDLSYSVVDYAVKSRVSILVMISEEINSVLSVKYPTIHFHREIEAEIESHSYKVQVNAGNENMINPRMYNAIKYLPVIQRRRFQLQKKGLFIQRIHNAYNTDKKVRDKKYYFLISKRVIMDYWHHHLYRQAVKSELQ